MLQFTVWDFLPYYIQLFHEREAERVVISLKAARINADISQQEISKILGVSPSTISRWETGQLKVPDNIIEKYCEICKIKKEDLKLQ